MDRRPAGPNGMLQLCKERGLKLFCYGVVAGGLLTSRYMERGSNPLFGKPPRTPDNYKCSKELPYTQT